jgi:hypothetical protein
MKKASQMPVLPILEAFVLPQGMPVNVAMLAPPEGIVLPMRHGVTLASNYKR